MIEPLWEEKCAPLVDRDHFTRDALLKRGTLSETYHPEMEKVHVENAAKLQKLIQKHGFPVLSNAGDKGVRLTWLIIQHAISLPDFMREGLLQMELAAAADDYPRELVAYTTDRVRLFEGKLQLYGTNADWQNGELRVTPIEDEELVDERRKSMNLPPLARGAIQVAHDRPPSDPVKKEREYQEWLKKVGWRI